MHGLRLFLLMLFAASSLGATKPAMKSRTFKAPPDFLYWTDSTDKKSADNGIDPFGPAPVPATSLPADAPLKHPVSARETLEAVGISFPEGATASFNPFTGALNVTNTQDNLDLTEIYIESLRKVEPATVAFALTVIEGPGDLIRKTNDEVSKVTDCSPQLAALLKQAKEPGSKIRVIGDAFLEGKSGVHATLEAVCEHRHATQFALDAKSRSSITQEVLPIGLRLEVEPIVGADGSTIQTRLALKLNAAPPEQRKVSADDPATGHAVEFPVTDFPEINLSNEISLASGHTRLIAVAKPVGTAQEGADILCAAFLTAKVRRLEALPMAQLKVAAPSSLPSGMTFAALPAPGVFLGPGLDDPEHDSLDAWLTKQGVTFPKGSSLEHRDNTLRCVNTLDNIALIAAITEWELGLQPRTVALTLHTVEAPEPFLRDLARKTLAAADDSAMLEAVEAAAARGEATFISSAFLETKSGNRATYESKRNNHYLDEFGTDAQGRTKLTFFYRPVGTVFEVEPVIGADNSTVEINFSVELHPTAPAIHRAHFRDPASQQAFDIPLTDFNAHKTVTSLSLTKGGAKLLSLNAPTGREKPGMLWATFLKCDVVPQLSKPRHVKAKPATAPKPAADPEAIHTRSFRVPADFLSWASDFYAKDGKKKATSAKALLEEHGIPFPEGAAAFYGAPTTVLVVTNKNKNLDLIEIYLDSISDFASPPTLAFTTHVIQGPGPLLRHLTAQAATKCDHRAELNELLAGVKSGSVQHLNSARIETQPGARATCQQSKMHNAFSDMRVNEKGELVFEQKTQRVGLNIDLEATLDSDGRTVEVNLAPEFHTAPPFEHREQIIDTQGRRLEFPLTDYFTSKVTTGIAIPDGAARLVSLYKPTGKAEFEKQDVLQAIFITCDVIRLTE
ncbi:hypothetical protein [Prosthecobacter sp.]|uniref:hypothetical protein n=1 Tax=Prosthecobacter sp. TaxID=1965333 RepID=UPI00378389BE